MISIDDIKIYLPPYLTEESQSILIKYLNDFPDNIDSRLYEGRLEAFDFVFQGDGFLDFELLDIEGGPQKVSAIVLSNTCDMYIQNRRLLPPRVIYSPIFRFEKYIEYLSKQSGYPEEVIENHSDAVKRQHISQILYLPKGRRLNYDGIVFLDRLYNCSRDRFNEKIKSDRIFCLSDYGWYLLLFKMSVHFSRMQERVDRAQGLILQEEKN